MATEALAAPLDAERATTLDGLFKQWDLDGNGVIDMHELGSVLHALNEGQGKRAERKYILRFMAKLRYKYAQPHTVQQLSPAEFRELLGGLTQGLSSAEFTALVSSLERYISEATKLCVNGRVSRKVFDLFNVLDSNGNGLIEFDELMVVFPTETRGLRKNALRWRSKLLQEMQGSSSRVRMTLSQFQSFIREHFKEFVHDEELFVSKVDALIQDALKSEVLQGLRYLIEKNVVDLVEALVQHLLDTRPVGGDVFTAMIHFLETSWEAKAKDTRLRRTE